MENYEVDARIDLEPVRPALSALGGVSLDGRRLAATSHYLSENGRPLVGVMGELHFSRRPAEGWADDLRKARAGGVNIISSYVFWIHHEEREGKFDWSGNRNLHAFVEACAEVGMDLIVRIGPFCHGEVRNGGIPDWLYGRPFPLREDDPRYLSKVRRFYGEIGAQLSGFLFSDGGPIIGIQVENELGHAGAPWETAQEPGTEFVTRGLGGAAHLATLVGLAKESGIDAPLWTSTGWGGAPVARDKVLPLYGGYAFCPWNVTPETPVQAPTREYLFRDFHSAEALRDEMFDPPYPAGDYPFACCEMGGGMQVWRRSRFLVPPASPESMAYVKVAGGCSVVGYYMYSGGTNPTGEGGQFLNEHVTPRLSYDFQAPLSETGVPRESYHRLRLFHYLLETFSPELGPLGTALPADPVSDPSDRGTLRYAARTDGRSGFLFVNSYQDHVEPAAVRDFAVSVSSSIGPVRFPFSGRMTLPPSECAALPFGFHLAGAELRSSTAQPVFFVEDEVEDAWFFSVLDGFPAEFVFRSDSVASIDATEGGSVRRDGDFIIATPAVGPEGGFTISSASARSPCRVIVLHKREALGLWRVRLGGRGRAVLTDADALWEIEGRIELRRSGVSSCSLRMWPGSWASPRVLEAPPKGIDLKVSGLGGPDVELAFPAGFLPDESDAFLEVVYSGDSAAAFIDGKLVHDDFEHGEPWRIPLRPLRTELSKGMYLHVVPRREGIYTVVESGMALQKKFSGTETARIDSVRVIPLYSFCLS